MPVDYHLLEAANPARPNPVNAPRPPRSQNQAAGVAGAAAPNTGRPPSAPIQPGNFLGVGQMPPANNVPALLTPPPAFRHNMLGWLNRVPSPLSSPSAGIPSSAVSQPNFSGR